MTSIQLNNTYPEDERWIEAGADAFALHIAACCYSDRMDKDGLVPKSMVARIALMVDPSKVDSAVESLVESGFWSSAGRSYRINNYLEDKIGLSAEEKISTRNKWAENKRTRRQHLNGNHEACSPKACKYAELSTVDSAGDSVVESTQKSKRSPRSSTLPETTRPYPNPGGVSGSGEGERSSGPASAGATASPAAAERQAVRRPAVVTFADLPEAFRLGAEEDGEPRTPEELAVLWDALYADPESPLFGTWAPPQADPAESLDGLLPAEPR